MAREQDATPQSREHDASQYIARSLAEDNGQPDQYEHEFFQSKARNVLYTLAAAGYRIVKQEQIGWRHVPAGFLISGVEPDPSESLRLVHEAPFEPVWRDLP